MGTGRIFQQLWPKLENAMTSVQSSSDGGTQPDDSAVVLIQTWLTKLNNFESAEDNLIGQMAIMEAGTDKVALDAAGNGLYGIRKVMKRYIGHISDTLSCRPLRDVFDPVDTNDEFAKERYSDKAGW